MKHREKRRIEIRVEDLIMPLFVREDIAAPAAVRSMPGIFQFDIASAVAEAGRIHALGIPAILVFGIPARKDDEGSEAYNPDGIVQRAIRDIKKVHPSLSVWADCCLCEYTSNGECGIVIDGSIHNNVTREKIGKTAVSQARAGADKIAPSGMVRHRVRSIRQDLDAAGFQGSGIISYAAKYASNFYGPFREAAGSTYEGGARPYQLDPSDRQAALQEVKQDVAEGAEAVIVKPALPYLDVIFAVRESYDGELIAYNVSGEYAMIKFASKAGALDERSCVEEAFLSIRRAGADRIISYFSKDYATWRKKTPCV